MSTWVKSHMAGCQIMVSAYELFCMDKSFDIWSKLVYSVHIKMHTICGVCEIIYIYSYTCTYIYTYVCIDNI